MEDLICQVLILDMMIYLQSFYSVKNGFDEFFSPNATKQVKTDLVFLPKKFYLTDNVPFDNPQK